MTGVAPPSAPAPIAGAVPEEALESGLPVVDPHHHLWRTATVPHGRQTPYGAAELGADTSSGHRVLATVFVECSAEYRTQGPEHLRPVGETEWVAGLTPPFPGAVAGIVGAGDVRLGHGMAAQLDEHLAVAGDRIRGVRARATWDADAELSSSGTPGMLRSDRAAQAADELIARDLLLEVWVYAPQLGDVAVLAARRPELRIVVDHLGGPPARGHHARDRPRTVAAWRAAIDELARHENVVLKIGGIGQYPMVEPWLAARRRTSAELARYWGPDIEHAVEAFGPDRCMAESNYPVDAYLADYVVVWNTFKRVTAGCSPTERARLLHGTATDVYRLHGVVDHGGTG